MVMYPVHMKMNRRWFRAIALYLLPLLVGCGALPALKAAPDSEPPEAQIMFGPYTVAIYPDDASIMRNLIFSLDGRNILQKQNYRFYFPGEDHPELPAVGEDLTGDGRPNLVIAGYSGGMNCCTELYFFELHPVLRQYAGLDAGRGYMPFEFVDLDGNGVPEVVMTDRAFALWRASFADSPASRVILRFQDGQYRGAPDLMRGSPIPEHELEQRGSKIEIEYGARATQTRPLGDYLPPLLWETMLELIHSGHANLAEEFVFQYWPAAVEERDEFLADFAKQIDGSLYIDTIRELNKEHRSILLSGASTTPHQ